MQATRRLPQATRRQPSNTATRLSDVAATESLEGPPKALVPDGVDGGVEQRVEVAEPENEARDDVRQLT